MKATNIVVSLVLFALSAGVLLGTWHLPYWADFAPGSAFAPFWVGFAGVVLAVVLLVGTLSEHDGTPHSFPDRRGLMRVGGVAVGLFALLAAIPLIGFIPAGILFCLYLLLGVERRPLLPTIATTVIVIGLVYGVFVAWLGIALPRGAFGV
ncbi:tripartite tricarboxylate transporter TctB family protein [Bosea sp. 117]|uniref:tripartite tricarboxylate transporter TctB family protein n=1 Tax=Bosea sp. 117 TaxID=1125973 RepID=UPI00057142E9|nr:tripartite tricarboxylate transporter TctB family protein [Bosea sp. 117]